MGQFIGLFAISLLGMAIHFWKRKKRRQTQTPMKAYFLHPDRIVSTILTVGVCLVAVIGLKSPGMEAIVAFGFQAMGFPGATASNPFSALALGYIADSIVNSDPGKQAG